MRTSLRKRKTTKNKYERLCRRVEQGPTSVDWWNTLHQPASVFRIGGLAADPSILMPLLIIVGRDGRIAHKLVGPITADNLIKVLKPEIEKVAKGL
jgi:hypothetical protein